MQQDANEQHHLLKQQKSDLSSFKFKPRQLLQSALFTLEEHFDPLTCTLNLPQLNKEERYANKLDFRQLLVDILRHLFAPIDELKTIKNNRFNSKKNQKKDENLSSYTDEQLLSAYFPIIEDILRKSVKNHPNLILLASSELSIPIKPGLFTKMIHSLVFNGNVETIQAISSIIDEYYNSNAANPYIEYFQYEPDEISKDNANESKTTPQDHSKQSQPDPKQPEKPWLISSKSEWTFLPYQMIDSLN